MRNGFANVSKCRKVNRDRRLEVAASRRHGVDIPDVSNNQIRRRNKFPMASLQRVNHNIGASKVDEEPYEVGADVTGPARD